MKAWGVRDVSSDKAPKVFPMCRLVGIIASEPTEFALVLKEAPRSLATLSREHKDGWGIAVHDQAAHGWTISRGTETADSDDRFHEIAAGSRGQVLVAHVRQKTVGSTRIENTHPFARDGWVFAHNGTISECKGLSEGASAKRLGEITGDTDSELLFAYLLTQLDRHDLLRVETEDARDAASALLDAVTAELRAARIGAFNFLLSNGDTCFAHRFGRSLYTLERTPTDPTRERRTLTQDTTLMTRWTSRRQAVFIASERITDEPWQELPDGALVRIDRVPSPRIAFTAAPKRAA